MIDPNQENIFILVGQDEGFNPLHASLVHGVGTPSPVGALVRGLLLFLPFVAPTLLFFLWRTEKGGEKKNE